MNDSRKLKRNQVVRISNIGMLPYDERKTWYQAIVSLYNDWGVQPIGATYVTLKARVAIDGVIHACDRVKVMKKTDKMHFLVGGSHITMPKNSCRYEQEDLVFETVEKKVTFSPVDDISWVDLRLITNGKVPLGCLSLAAPPATGKSHVASELMVEDGDVVVAEHYGRRWETDKEYRTGISEQVIRREKLICHSAVGIPGSFDVLVTPKDFARNLKRENFSPQFRGWYVQRAKKAKIMLSSSDFIDFVEDLTFFKGETDLREVMEALMAADDIVKGNNRLMNYRSVDFALDQEILKFRVPEVVSYSWKELAEPAIGVDGFQVSLDDSSWSLGLLNSNVRILLFADYTYSDYSIRAGQLRWPDGMNWALAQIHFTGDSLVEWKTGSVRRLSKHGITQSKALGFPTFKEADVLIGGVRKTLNYYDVVGRLERRESVLVGGREAEDPLIKFHLSGLRLPGGGLSYAECHAFTYKEYTVLIPMNKDAFFMMGNEPVALTKPIMACHKTGLPMRRVGEGLYSDGDSEVFPAPGGLITAVLGNTLYLRKLSTNEMPPINFCLSEELWDEESMKMWESLANIGAWHPIVRLALEKQFFCDKVCHRWPSSNDGTVNFGKRFRTSSKIWEFDESDADQRLKAELHFELIQLTQVERRLNIWKWSRLPSVMDRIEKLKVDKTPENDEHLSVVVEGEVGLIEQLVRVIDRGVKTLDDGSFELVGAKPLEKLRVIVNHAEKLKAINEVLELKFDAKEKEVEILKRELEVSRGEADALDIALRNLNSNSVDQLKSKDAELVRATKNYEACFRELVVAKESLKKKAVAADAKLADDLRARDIALRRKSEEARSQAELFRTRVSELEYQNRCADTEIRRLRAELKVMGVMNMKKDQASILVMKNNVLEVTPREVVESDVDLEEISQVEAKEDIRPYILQACHDVGCSEELVNMSQYGHLKTFSTVKLMKDLKVERPEVSRLCYELQRRGLLEKVVESPPTWKFTANSRFWNCEVNGPDATLD